MNIFVIMEKSIKKVDIEKHYDQHCGLFESLGSNLKRDVEKLLNDAGISYHSVSYRVKDKESYMNKIERKSYDNYEEQVEDFCGLRIVCYYPHDLNRIEQEVIHAEFDVKETIDKTKEAGEDRFGYRSNHYIVTVKKDWIAGPAYRALANLKVEIQVRTILMHAWADIEHKLAYKNAEQVPLELRRRLSQLSALLELADEQFQFIKNERENIKGKAIKKDGNVSYFDLSQSLNLDTLKTYLDFRYPNRQKDTTDRYIGELLEELLNAGIDFKELEDAYLLYGKYLNLIDQLFLKSYQLNIGKFSQVGILRKLMEAANDKYLNYRILTGKATKGNVLSVRKKLDIEMKKSNK